MNNISLIEAIDILSDYKERGYDVYFEGRGDGYVRAIAEAVFIVDKK